MALAILSVASPAPDNLSAERTNDTPNSHANEAVEKDGEWLE